MVSSRFSLQPIDYILVHGFCTYFTDAYPIVSFLLSCPFYKKDGFCHIYPYFLWFSMGFPRIVPSFSHGNAAFWWQELVSGSRVQLMDRLTKKRQRDPASFLGGKTIPIYIYCIYIYILYIYIYCIYIYIYIIYIYIQYIYIYIIHILYIHISMVHQWIIIPKMLQTPRLRLYGWSCFLGFVYTFCFWSTRAWENGLKCHNQ